MRWFIVILLIFTGAFSQQNSVRIRTPNGPVTLTLQDDNVTFGTVTSDIKIRLANLSQIAEQQPECANLFNPILAEIAILITLFPNEILKMPIDIEDMKPMQDEPFAQLLLLLEGETFSDDQLVMLQQVSIRNHFTAKQLGNILDKFTFSEDKLNAVRIILNRLVDPENAFLLMNKFSFETDKEEFMKIISE